jgi:CelD/BcsL family acetyltransferase involved in cellulose biosynthesis
LNLLLHKVNSIAENTMRLTLIRNAHEWDLSAQEWNALLSESHIDTPFQTYEFQRDWWEAFGGGEWKNAELHIVTGRGDHGQLRAIAPLFYAHGQLLFIGSHEIADYLDVIVRHEDHAGFSNSLIEYLANSAEIKWNRIELYNMPDDSRTPGFLEAAVRSHGLNFMTERLKASPYIRVPASFEEFLDNLPSKQAHEMRRKLRRAARNPAPITVDIVSEASQLEKGLEDFFALMNKDAEKAAFLRRDGMRRQVEKIARSAFEAGWLQLFFLKCGSQRIAAYMNFDYGNRIWAYNAGFDPEFAHLSPGWLLMAEMMKWCIANGREVFDFMRGAEEYKYRLGGIVRYVNKVTISRKGEV